MIVSPTNLDQRIEFMKKILKVAEELKNIQNFHSLAGVTVGLNVASINRLKITKNGLSKRIWKIIDDLKCLFDPSSSYKNYRSHIAKCVTPLIPYLFVFCFIFILFIFIFIFIYFFLLFFISFSYSFYEFI